MTDDFIGAVGTVWWWVDKLAINVTCIEVIKYNVLKQKLTFSIASETSSERGPLFPMQVMQP